MSGPTRVSPSASTSNFVGAVALLGVLFGIFTRARISAGSPLPSDTPFRWYAHGIAEDTAIFFGVASLTLLATAFLHRERLFARAFVLFAIVVSIGQLVGSELLLVLGSYHAAIDFKAGDARTVFMNSLQRAPGMLFAGSLAVLVAVPAFVSFRVRHAQRRLLGTRSSAMIAGVALALAFAPLHAHRIETSHNPLVVLADPPRDDEHWIDTEKPIPLPTPSLPASSVRELICDRDPKRFLSDEYPLAFVPLAPPLHPVTTPDGRKPNIVFFVVEGLRAEEIGVYGNNPPGVTPNLDRLAREGVLVKEAYSASTYTPAGVLALWYGIMPLPNEIFVMTRPQTHVTGLPEILRANGWNDALWIHDGDSNFYRRNRFYIPRGVKMIDGKDFPQNAPRTNWGFSDRTLAREAVKALDHANGPFVSMILTVTNHHPFEIPSDAGPRYAGPKQGRRNFVLPGHDQVFGLHTDAMIDSIHYSDEAIGDFIRLASTRPWFKDTIFVFTGDHGVGIPPFKGELTTEHQLSEARHRVPLVFYSPLLRGGQVVTGPASSLDVAPTLLDLAGVTAPRPFLGRNLLDENYPEEQKMALLWSLHERAVTVVTPSRAYHGLYEASGPIFEKPPDDEYLVDRVHDPAGEHNLAAAEPELVNRFRHVARLYTSVYSWLLINGRTGLP